MSISALELCYPSSISSYNHAQLLHKAYNSENQKSDWIEIQFNDNFNERANNAFMTPVKTNKVKTFSVISLLFLRIKTLHLGKYAL